MKAQSFYYWKILEKNLIIRKDRNAGFIVHGGAIAKLVRDPLCENQGCSLTPRGLTAMLEARPSKY